MNTQKEKELFERVAELEATVNMQIGVIEKCYNFMGQMLDTQSRLIKVVGFKRTRTKKGG